MTAGGTAGTSATGQSRAMSIVEAVANVAVGYVVSVLATVLILPAFGYSVSGGDALAISTI